MTPFEIQVAKALAVGVASPCPLCQAHAEEFAPRVVAAIRAAWQMFPWELARQADLSVNYENQAMQDRCEAAALTALRGAVRAPAETPE